MKKSLQSKRRGSAMALVLIAVVILLVVGSDLLSLGMHGRMLAARTGSEIAARTAADAGLTKAVFEMNQRLKAGTWDSNSLPQTIDAALPNCDATFNYTVTDNLDNTYTVDVTGRAVRALRKVSCILTIKSIFQYAATTQSGMELSNESLVDAYSSDGTEGGEASVATNSTDPDGVVLEHDSFISGGIIWGANMNLPRILPPSGGAFDISKGAITSSMTISEDGRYDYIDLTNGQKLTISGDVTLYVPGDVSANQASEVEILPDSSLTLYAGDNLIVRNASLVNNLMKETRKCQVYGVGNDQIFWFGNESVFYGVIYAPDAYIIVRNSADVYGAIVSDFAELDNSAALHYDSTLAAGDVGDLGATFVIEHWQEE